jgi:hypothetical protein
MVKTQYRTQPKPTLLPMPHEQDATKMPCIFSMAPAKKTLL